MGEETRGFVLLNASYKHLSSVGRIDIAVDDFELQVGIALIQIYLVIHVRRGATARIQEGAPFDVEDAATRGAFNRSEDSAARAIITVTSTRGVIRALVRPQRKGGIGIRASGSVCHGKTHADPIRAVALGADKVQAAVGVDVNTIKCLIV